MRGAWVEMPQAAKRAGAVMSLPVRGAWVEISDQCTTPLRPCMSLPVRGAWVEMRALLFKR